MGFLKPVIWMGVAGTLATGTALAVMGPNRAQALFSSVHGKVNSAIDSRIDDPVALRQQLKGLADQYPERISEVRGDLAQLQAEIGQLERERAVSQRVAQLARADLEQMKSMLARASDAASEGRIVRVRFGNESLDVERAQAKAVQISQLTSAYAEKASDIDGNLSVLRQQEARLVEILDQLETERAEFQAQLWQLDRQVDAIARNDRMIDLLEKRQKSLAKYDRYGDVATPDAVRGRIARVLAEQESRLNNLALATNQTSYERQAEADLARQELIYQSQLGAELLGGGALELEAGPEVLEIGPEKPAPKAPHGPLATRD
jgi:chromosome segregation ATPase